MSNIIRVSKGKDNPFVMINKLTLTDAELTWEARGVLAYLLSKPDDWQVRVWDLVRQGPGGRQRMQRILKELETAGYMERRRLRNGNGTFYWETIVYERPTIGGKSTHGSATHGKPAHIPRSDATKNEKEDTSASAKRPRVSSGKNAIRTSLEAHFVNKTKIPLPARETARQQKAASVRWWQPLRRILDLCEWDEQKAKGLVDAALNRLADLTVVCPQSIVGTAEGIIGERARGVARSTHSPDIAVGPSSRARSGGE